MRPIACALAGALLCASAHGQTDPIPPPAWIPEVIVTGTRPGYSSGVADVTRTGLPLLRTPQSVQVLTGTLLREQDLSTLSDALKNISGAVPALPSEALLANPLLRGFEAEVFVAGLPAYGDTSVVDPASLWGYERVEVAKGPATLLFGGGTGAPLGGLINLVPKTPGRDRAVEAELRTGSFGLVQPRVDVDLPLSDQVGVRLAAETTRGGDPVRSVEPWRLALNPSLRVDVGEDTTITGRAQYTRVEQREYAGLPAEIARSLPSRFRFSGATDTPKATIENLLVDGVLTHRLSETVSGTLHLRRYRSEFDEIATFPFLSFFPLEGTQAPIITGRLPVEVREWTVDGSLSATLTTGPVEHRILGGILYDRTDYRGQVGFDFTPIGILDYADPDSDVAFRDLPPVRSAFNNYRTLAAYLQDAASWGPLTLQAGLRFSRYRLEELTGGAGTDDTYQEVDPRVGAALEVVDGLSLFAAYAEGSRLTIFFSGSQPPVPERSRTVEGGIKVALSDLGLSGTLAGFSITRQNVPTPDPAVPFSSVQTGEQRSRGAELDLIWEPTPDWSLLATYAYTDATVTRDTAIPVGDQLTRVPGHSGRVAGRYRVRSGPLAGLGVGLGVTAAEAAEITLPNSARGDTYALVDAQASYDWGSFRLGLSVQNLTDRRYFIPYQYLGQAVVRPGDPRSAFLTLGVQF